MDRFEADLMDDLMSDAAEGPAARHGHAYDEFDEFDEGDEFDGADAGDDEFLGQLLGGIGRANALRAGRLSEGVVRLEDLPGVQAVAFVNSLRGWLDADLEPRRG